MGLIARAWLWLTERLLAGERLGAAGGYVVVDADTEREAIHALAGTDSPQALADRLDLPAYQSPVDALQRCEDSPRHIYAWEVADDARARSLLEALEAHGVEEMDALHVVLTDREELARLEYDDIRTYVDAGIETEGSA